MGVKMTHDKTVKFLMNEVKQKRKDLGTKKRFIPVTNAKFMFDNETYMNLNVESNPYNYARALAFLLMRQNYYNNACKQLGLAPDKFLWGGYTVKEWQTDFKARVEILDWKSRKSKLDSIEKRLEALLSEEGKTAAALDDITSLLNE